MPARTPTPPLGQRWCSRHKSLHPAADFSPTDFYCRDGRREYERDRKAGVVLAPKAKSPVQTRRLPPDPIPVITLLPPKPTPVPPPPQPTPPKQKGWRALPTKEPVESQLATTKADAVPAGQPWTREATEHETAMLAHGANVVSQIRAAHFALDVITSGWALMNKDDA